MNHKIDFKYTRCDQKFLGPICLGEIYRIKIFVSRSFDPSEGHWECSKHAVMLGCFKRGGCDTFAKWRK